MQKAVLLILSTALVSGSMIPAATATGHNFQKEHSYTATPTSPAA
jgi:hypothetical protein